MTYRLAIVKLLSASMFCASTFPGLAQDFFQGKTIRIVVGSAVGASYDSYSRILAPYLRSHISGNPNILVQNMPGAGGLVAANYIFNVAERDGLTIGMFNRSSVLSSIVGHPQSKFKPEQIYWLGTTASFSDNAYLFVTKGLPYKTIVEIRTAQKPISVGNSGSAPVRVLKDVLGLNVKIIDGYGKSELDLAFERGELDGAGIAYANLQARHPEWLTNKMINPIIQFARQSRHPDFPDVPTAHEAARTADEKALIDLVDAPFLIAYPYGLPPGVPSDRAELLRQAFGATLTDGAYELEVRSKKLEHSPKNGLELQEIISHIASTNPSVIAQYKEIIGNATSD